ncbi:MAG: Ni/Fe hydrogenase subunit alpha [Armatimonadota bacterium]|nr:Ni/Fe hydrogenase subunit alpha [bacterium]MCS7309516.1 Ni/Fe hydrogenase subunit alpha [Armatimonadota bacterium]MDW8104368.1 Ni/Fe hydrogenase subunit alpha [Armatimonadota bacterium]MDW8290396.1 Ni/Fe hydrogenase subunit alpha [Armatimonadota bacterium]
MAQTVTIDPITRIEGHAKITIHLDDQGIVRDARLHITQFRGFEKLCEGRRFTEMPALTARICGICPVSHLIASGKACDALLAVRIPETAEKLRRILNLAQIVQSHALSFFHLSSPDFLLGMDADPAKRNLVGVIQTNPQMARDGIRLRQFGQQIIEWLAGKRIHPSWIVPGGVAQPLSPEKREQMLAGIPEAIDITQRAIEWFRSIIPQFSEEAQTFANFPSLFLGLVTETGALEHYDGVLRVVDSAGNVIADKLDPNDYQEYIGEAVEPWTYLKFPYYKPIGYPEGIYRVGPLARLNLIDRCGTPLADEAWAEFRLLERGAVLSSFYYHYARLIEILYALERIQQLLNEPDILDTHVQAMAGPNRSEGIGVAEAPRGTLIHHYRIDKDGLITWANLIIATGHNNLAMNRGILQAAKHFIKGDRIQEGMLNRVEAVIRCFDPCLSCSTHAVGQMPLHIQLLSPTGEVLDEVRR